MIEDLLLAGLVVVGCGSPPAASGRIAVPRHTPSLADACEAGRGSACYSLALEADDASFARRFYGRACAAAMLDGCVDLGALLAHGRGGTVDWAGAERLFQRACEGGDQRGCSSWATVYFEGPVAKRDEVRAATMSAKACDAGDVVACGNLGFQYLTGRGVELDTARGVALDERACRDGNGPACMNLGYLYSTDNMGVTRDEARATAYLIAACEAVTPSYPACGMVAFRIAQGTGIPPNAKRGLSMLDRACAGGHAVSCAQLAEYYQTQDAPRAQTYRERACALGRDDACRTTAPTTPAQESQ